MPTKSKLEADIDNLINYIDNLEFDTSTERFSTEFGSEEKDLILDALVFYKEMNTY